MSQDDGVALSDVVRKRELSFLSNISGETGYSTPSLTIERRRSPSTKAILLDIKSKLVDELKIIEEELGHMELEKSLLCSFRDIILQCLTSLLDPEQKIKIRAVPEEMKVIIENFLSDIDHEETNIKKGVGIPFLSELCKQLQKLKETTEKLLQCLFCMENIEDFFWECGLLYGILDCILSHFYEEAGKEEFKVETNGTILNGHLHNIGQNSHGWHAEAEQTTDGENTDNDEDSLVQQTMEISFGLNESSMSQDSDNNAALSAVIKDIRKMKKILKSIDRISSGKPKFKVLISKFQEINLMLKDPNHDEICKQYPIILHGNFHELQTVLSCEKPGQCELSNACFLLAQLAGRVRILKQL